MKSDFEKLGAFYLGCTHDLDKRQRTDQLVLYDSRDLVTHAVCVGMTGSGKTGLCVTLLEEAAIDGVPAIVIDPKGDLANLLLTFPELQASDFAPWMNEEDARRKGLTPDAYARQQADLWKNGLAQWGQDGARIRRLREAAEFTIYTPGSTAGIPVSILRSFAAPPPAIMEDTELLQERIASTATSLLAMAGVEADPLQSREHLLISTLLGDAWARGRDLDLAGLIQGIQTPPVTRIGVMELESLYSARERFALAMKINTLIASPGFSRWIEGEALDIGQLLYTGAGRPRVAIFSIAHLGDAERMFFVSLLLNQTLAWVRTQSGTTSLRAILYMDEIAGYFPPTANPPSKGPLLTLMKQARAFGVGVVLATQNPVDLDYKGLANAGTWFIGRLQTERDKARVLDGLEGAAAGASGGFDRAAMDRMMSQLGNRVFLMNNVHEDAPEVFEVRWAMSYLRGPLTREQIKALRGAERPSEAGVAPVRAAAAPAAPPAEGPSPVGVAADARPPVLPPGIIQRFIPSRAPAGAALVYQPMLLASARVYYSDARTLVDQEKTASYLIQLGQRDVVNWDGAEPTDLTDADLESEPAGGARFAPLPPEAGREKSYESWTKRVVDFIYRGDKLELMCCPRLKVTSRPGESERDFRVRLAQSAREERDAVVEKLRARYTPKLAALQDRIRRAQQTLAVQQQQASAARMSTAVSFGTAVLSALFGRKLASAANIGKAGTAVRGVGRSMKESGDVGRAEETIAALQGQLAELDAEFQREVSEAEAACDPAVEPLETIALKPKKTHIEVRPLILAWAPYTASVAGQTPAWR